MADTTAAGQEREAAEVRHITTYLDGLAIPTRGDDDKPLTLIARINIMTARCVQAKKDLAESRYQTACVLSERLEAAEAESEELKRHIASFAKAAEVHFATVQWNARASISPTPDTPLTRRSKIAAIGRGLDYCADHAAPDALPGAMREAAQKLAVICAEDRAASSARPTPETAEAVPDPVHLIFFDDQDRRPEIFAGRGATAAAHHRFKVISAQWNAHLFVKLKSNSRDDQFAKDNASICAPAAEAVQLGVIRKWPDGMADRVEHVWRDLIGFTIDYKLYDLMRVLAEFGFTLSVHEAEAARGIGTTATTGQAQHG